MSDTNTTTVTWEKWNEIRSKLHLHYLGGLSSTGYNTRFWGAKGAETPTCMTRGSSTAIEIYRISPAVNLKEELTP